ncbi:hypothetical protein [Roseibium sp.]|uniref:hypothetical protein n=1 Tax=Roseibium sp. TaxID=1936156 RepID=UPI003A971012
MRNLVQIFITGIFLLGVVLPGAGAHGLADGPRMEMSHAAKLSEPMPHMHQHGAKHGRPADCPAGKAGVDGKIVPETCCQSSCFVDLAILQAPVFSGWKVMAPYLPMTGSLTDASRYRVEHPPRS